MLLGKVQDFTVRPGPTKDNCIRFGVLPPFLLNPLESWRLWSDRTSQNPLWYSRTVVVSSFIKIESSLFVFNVSKYYVQFGGGVPCHYNIKLEKDKIFVSF